VQRALHHLLSLQQQLLLLLLLMALLGYRGVVGSMQQ
jgi:hypothetical protein